MCVIVTDSSSASASPCAVTPTVCAVFQLAAVNVSDAEPPDTDTAPVSPLATATVTFPVGCADSRTV